MILPRPFSCLRNVLAGAFEVRRGSKLMVLIVVIVIVYLLTNWIYLAGISASSGTGRVTNRRQTFTATSRYRHTPAGIPQLLHFVYRDANMLEAYRPNIASCVKLNCNWTVILWTDDSVKLLLATEFSSLQDVFYKFKYKIQRADAIRYVILHRFGGVYLDLDMLCHQPLLTSLSDIPCFLDQERGFQTRHSHGRAYYAMNSAMGCRPKHPFFKLMIDSVFHADRLSDKAPFPYVIFNTTGPGILTRNYEDWMASNSTPPVTLLRETYFSPKIAPGIHAECRRIIGALSKRKGNPTALETSCLGLSKLGFEKADEKFMTNLTVAIHQFTHLGYDNQKTKTFDIRKDFPGVLIYDNTATTDKEA